MTHTATATMTIVKQPKVVTAFLEGRELKQARSHTDGRNLFYMDKIVATKFGGTFTLLDTLYPTQNWMQPICKHIRGFQNFNKYFNEISQVWSFSGRNFACQHNTLLSLRSELIIACLEGLAYGERNIRTDFLPSINKTLYQIHRGRIKSWNDADSEMVKNRHLQFSPLPEQSAI